MHSIVDLLECAEAIGVLYELGYEPREDSFVELSAGQYQSLAKASSLAAAIGYPDIMQMIGGTVLSQTSQALEAMTLVIVLYAALNMLIALLTSLANFRLLRGRVR